MEDDEEGDGEGLECPEMGEEEKEHLRQMEEIERINREGANVDPSILPGITKEALSCVHKPFEICVCCDLLILGESIDLNIEEFTNNLSKWKPLLEIQESHRLTNELLISQCDISQYSPIFKGLLLSPRGVYRGETQDLSFKVCSECYEPLQKSKLPKFAISNHNFVGSFPETLTVDDIEIRSEDFTAPEIYLCKKIQTFPRLSHFVSWQDAKFGYKSIK